MSGPDTSRISPTAHYTGYVWYRAGLSFPCLRTDKGERLFRLLQPFNAAYLKLRGGPTVDGFLLQRHLIIDALLEEAIAAGHVGQVVEVAAGLSPRGARMTRDHPELTWVEGDLPDMAALKRRTLEQAGLSGPNHHVVALNALVDEGPSSLSAVAGPLLDPSQGTALITEGLLSYFSWPDARGMWGRFRRFLEGYPSGLYLTDLHVEDDVRAFRTATAFRTMLSAFARGSVHLHHQTPQEAARRLSAAGFSEARCYWPSQMTHIDGIPRFERRDPVRVLTGRVGG